MMAGPLELERKAIDDAVDDRTLVDVLARNAIESPTAPAIAWREGGSWRRYAWSEYRQRALAVAAALMDLGVEAGERVAIMAGNRPEHVLADLGAIHAGATPVTVYSTLPEDQLAYVAGDAGAVVAIVEGAGLLARWTAVWSELPTLRHVVVLDTDLPAGTTGSVLTWESFIAQGDMRLAQDPPAVEERAGIVDPSSTATLIYTSGTTGVPKGVVISQRNVLWTLETMSRAIDLPDRARFVSYLPLAHIAERMASHYLGMWTTGEVTYCANVGAVMGIVREIEPHLFVGVPRIWEQVHRRLLTKLDGEDDLRRRALVQRALDKASDALDTRPSILRRLELAALDRAVLSKIRTELGMSRLVMAITTAGPIDPEIIRFFQTIGVPLHELYGMTECSGPATTNIPGHGRIGTVGRSFAGVEVDVLEDGELVIRGGNVAAGYERAPGATAEVFGADGWLRTGDLAEIDDEGYVSIVGRKKDIIVNAAGKNISPVAVEQRLKRHDIVGEVCVVGDRKPHLGALVVPDGDAVAALTGTDQVDPDDERIVAAIQAAVDEANEHLAPVERIRRFRVVADEWSPDSGVLTPSMKLRRNVVAERYASLIDEL